MWINMSSTCCLISNTGAVVECKVQHPSETGCEAHLGYSFYFHRHNPALILASKIQWQKQQHWSVQQCVCVFQALSAVWPVISLFLTAEETHKHLSEECVFSGGAVSVVRFVPADWWPCELLIWSSLSVSCDGCDRRGRQSRGQDVVIREEEPLPACLGFLRRAWLSATATPHPAPSPTLKHSVRLHAQFSWDTVKARLGHFILLLSLCQYTSVEGELIYCWTNTPMCDSAAAGSDMPHSAGCYWTAPHGNVPNKLASG